MTRLIKLLFRQSSHPSAAIRPSFPSYPGVWMWLRRWIQAFGRLLHRTCPLMNLQLKTEVNPYYWSCSGLRQGYLNLKELLSKFRLPSSSHRPSSIGTQTKPLVQLCCIVTHNHLGNHVYQSICYIRHGRNLNQTLTQTQNLQAFG